jgi:hypothetical protein
MRFMLWLLTMVRNAITLIIYILCGIIAFLLWSCLCLRAVCVLMYHDVCSLYLMTICM